MTTHSPNACADPAGHTRVSAVRGFHSHADWSAIDLGLTHRFAVIQNSHRCDQAGVYFDREVFLSLVTGVGSVFQASDMLARHDRLGLLKKADFATRLREERDADGDLHLPPASVDFLTGKSVVCRMDTEFWTDCGGPDPYHDSYTFSFYSTRDESPALEALAKACCARHSAEFTHVLSGSAIPPSRSVWSRFTRFVKALV